MINMEPAERIAKETRWYTFRKKDRLFINVYPLMIILFLHIVFFIVNGFSWEPFLFYNLLLSLIVIYSVIFYVFFKSKYDIGYVNKTYKLTFLKFLEKYFKNNYKLDKSLDYTLHRSGLFGKRYHKYYGYYDERSKLNIVIDKFYHYAYPMTEFTLKIGKVDENNYIYCKDIIKEIEKQYSIFSFNGEKK